MEYKYLSKIKSPEDLRALDASVLPALAEEIRDKMIRTVSVSGGHLASNLGVVELLSLIHI